jgi:hypothetical protein
MMKHGEEKACPRKSTEVIPGQKWLMRRIFISLLVLSSGLGAAASFRGIYAAPVHQAQFTTGASCVEQYNARLVEAKSALIKGDRAHALDSLMAAKDQLGRCQEREEESATHAVAVSLNLSGTHDLSGCV